jgi:hypothetical protein
MRLGILTDIHNHIAELATALVRFQEQGVEQVVTLGDTVEAFGRKSGTSTVAMLLADCRATGVWGNHDFSLCHQPEPETRAKYAPVVMQVLGQMQPQLVLDDVHLSHRESAIDPYDVVDMWGMDDVETDLPARAKRAFTSVAHRWQLVGHYHRWFAANLTGPLDWDGSQPLQLAAHERYFIAVGAVCDGHCAVLDTQTGRLEPLRCSE